MFEGTFGAKNIGLTLFDGAFGARGLKEFLKVFFLLSFLLGSGRAKHNSKLRRKMPEKNSSGNELDRASIEKIFFILKNIYTLFWLAQIF